MVTSMSRMDIAPPHFGPVPHADADAPAGVTGRSTGGRSPANLSPCEAISTTRRHLESVHHAPVRGHRPAAQLVPGGAQVHEHVLLRIREHVVGRPGGA